jgi:RNase P protein component
MLDPARYAEYDLLVVARPGAAELPFATLAAQIDALLRRVDGLVR